MFSPQVLLLLPPLNSDKLLFSVVLGGGFVSGIGWRERRGIRRHKINSFKLRGV